MSNRISYEPFQVIGPYGVIFLYEVEKKTQPCGKQVRRALFQCPLCGKHFEATIVEVKRGGIRSCGCYRTISKLKTHAKDLTGIHNKGKLKAIRRTDKKSPDNSYLWECICDCGNTTYVSVSDFFDTQSCGCLLFHSGGEFIVEKILQNNCIEYKKQYSFTACKDKRPLRFDFYLPHNNICIEVDGRQHEQPIDRFGGELSFIQLQKHDAIKDNYCKDHDILLIRIPYKREVNFEQRVISILQEQGVFGI